MCQNWHSVYFTNKIEFRLFLYFDLFDLEFFRALRDKFIAVQEPKGFMQFHQLPALFFIIAHIFLMLKEVKVSSVFCNGRDLHWLSVWAVSIYREHRISTSFGRRLIETFLVLALKLPLEWATPNMVPETWQWWITLAVVSTPFPQMQHSTFVILNNCSRCCVGVLKCINNIFSL